VAIKWLIFMPLLGQTGKCCRRVRSLVYLLDVTKLFVNVIFENKRTDFDVNTTSGPREKDAKLSTLVVRRSKVKVTRG